VIDKKDAEAFNARLAKVPEELKPLVLAMYAKPFHRKAELSTSESD